MTQNVYDLAIVGGGPGGLSAAIYAVRGNLNTILLEQGIYGGQLNLTDEIENYLGFTSISGTDLALSFTNHANLYNFETITEEVIKLKKIEHIFMLELSNGKKIQSRSVILATGGHPRKLEIPGETKFYGSGVSYCATCDGFFFKNKTVLVVGGGDSAVEESLYLAKLCNKVYLSYRGDSLRASKILQKRLMQNNKITISWNTIPTKIIGNKSGVSCVNLVNLKTNKEKELRTDGVFIFIGYEPNNQLVPKQVSITSNGMVMTDELCRTKIEGLYAIGDLRSKPARQVILSVADGCNAAIDAVKYIENLEN